MLMPRQPVPALTLPTLTHGTYDLMPDGAERLSLLVAYRGLHCVNGVALVANCEHTYLFNENALH